MTLSRSQAKLWNEARLLLVPYMTESCEDQPSPLSPSRAARLRRQLRIRAIAQVPTAPVLEDPELEAEVLIHEIQDEEPSDRDDAWDADASVDAVPETFEAPKSVVEDVEAVEKFTEKALGSCGSEEPLQEESEPLAKAFLQEERQFEEEGECLAESSTMEVAPEPLAEVVQEEALSLPVNESPEAISRENEDNQPEVEISEAEESFIGTAFLDAREQGTGEAKEPESKWNDIGVAFEEDPEFVLEEPDEAQEEWAEIEAVAERAGGVRTEVQPDWSEAAASFFSTLMWDRFAGNSRKASQEPLVEEVTGAQFFGWHIPWSQRGGEPEGPGASFSEGSHVPVSSIQSMGALATSSALKAARKLSAETSEETAESFLNSLNWQTSELTHSK